MNEIIKCLIQDFEMLDSGDWVPDSDSIGASLDNLYLLEEKTNRSSGWETKLTERLETLQSRVQYEEETKENLKDTKYLHQLKEDIAFVKGLLEL